MRYANSDGNVLERVLMKSKRLENGISVKGGILTASVHLKKNNKTFCVKDRGMQEKAPELRFRTCLLLDWL